jgi:hypothetical protein
MTRTRRSLGLITAVWLVSQAATLTLVPALLDAGSAQCTCPYGGADATCPMHHRTAASPKVCAMQSVTTGPAATLNALFSVVGLLPPSLPAIAPVPTASRLVLERSTETRRPSVPDPPPPRA